MQRSKLILYVICITIRVTARTARHMRRSAAQLDAGDTHDATEPFVHSYRTREQRTQVCAPRAVRFVHNATIDVNAAPTECNVTRMETRSICIVRHRGDHAKVYNTGGRWSAPPGSRTCSETLHGSSTCKVCVWCPPHTRRQPTLAPITAAYGGRVNGDRCRACPRAPARRQRCFRRARGGSAGRGQYPCASRSPPRCAVAA